MVSRAVWRSPGDDILPARGGPAISTGPASSSDLEDACSDPSVQHGPDKESPSTQRSHLHDTHIRQVATLL